MSRHAGRELERVFVPAPPAGHVRPQTVSQTVAERYEVEDRQIDPNKRQMGWRGGVTS